MTVSDILLPAAALVLWTLMMLGWMAATRIPAVSASGLDMTKAPPGGRGQDLEGVIPARVNWKAHNHTHLHEQPTLFYATVAIIAIAGTVTPLAVGLAWAYVALRIAHSLWQATVNIVRIRFLLFITSTACLGALAVIATLSLL